MYGTEWMVQMKDEGRAGWREEGATAAEGGTQSQRHCCWVLCS